MVKKLNRRRNPYEYFSVSADILVFKKKQNRVLEILLIRRKNPPFKNSWAIPGGFVDRHEDAYSAAKRELFEECGLKLNRLTEFGSFSHPNRDPRGRVVTISFFTFVKNIKPKAGDDAKEISWFPIRRLPRLAFDHDKMIKRALEKIRITRSSVHQ